MSNWIDVNDRLPELKDNTWRTGLPLWVFIDSFGLTLAYPCRWGGSDLFWKPANIMCNDNSEYPPTTDCNKLLNVTHWQPPPEPPKK